MSKSLLSHFINAAGEDPRIGPSHLAVYLVLYDHWVTHGCQASCLISRADIMQKVKVFSKATYHKCIADLSDFGHIRYFPSRKPGAGSLVQMCPSFK